MKKILGIIQARMGSTRLPGKMMKIIEGKPLIWHVVNRVKEANTINQIVIATTEKKDDEILLKKAEEYGIEGFVGSENDVLDRFFKSAKKYNGDIIVRLTGDCPLLDPRVIDKVIKIYLDNEYDYVSNVLKPTYPDGLDVEVFSFNTLVKVWKEAELTSDREHVTTYIRNTCPDKFKTKNVENDKDLSNLRWTVDQEEDLKFVRKIYSNLSDKKFPFYMEDVLRLLNKNPELKEINTGIQRDEGYLKSLKRDKIN